MKLCLFLTFVCVVQTFALDVLSQKTDKIIAQQETPLHNILEEIEELTNYRFLYHTENVIDKQIALDTKNKTWVDIFDQISKASDLNYEIFEEDLIVLSPVKKMQPIKVTGRVTDENGEPLPGVSISVKGTSKGTITDNDGNYTLTDVPAEAILVFSYVGMQTQEVEVGKQENIDAVMKKKTTGIEEVVVIGYGEQSRRWVTGSVSKIDMSESATLVNTNLTQSMRGNIAGIQVLDQGRAGQEGEILIRGPRSLAATNDPLIVLDGIIYQGSLDAINPRDIRSMEVLKDASSTAIYGSRAANGVILISTKSGISEKPTINFDALYGASDWGSYRLKLLSPERFIQSKLDYRRQSGEEADPERILDYLYNTEKENYIQGISHDPLEMISQPGRINNYDLSVSGGNDYYRFYISGGYSDHKGVILNDNRERISSRINLDAKITDWLDMGLNVNFSRRDQSGLEPNMNFARRANPYGNWYYEDGEPTRYLVPEDLISHNPLYQPSLTDNETIGKQLFNNLYADIAIPFITGLKYRFNFSPSFRWNHNYSISKQDPRREGNLRSASKSNSEYYGMFLENILQYKRSIGDNHNFHFTLLYGREHTEYETTIASADQLTTDILMYNKLDLGEVMTARSSANATDGVSSMLRLNYRFKDRYLVTLTARRDGSSVFAENYKYALFPSGALAWIVSDELFMQEISFVNMLKLRASYGAAGNKGISPYQSLSLASNTYYVYGDGGSTSIGIYPTRMGSPNLKWETTYTANLAVDFNLFDNRLGGTLEAYDMRTEDLIVQRSIPIMTGYSSIYTNLGEVNNRGIEVTLNTININNNQFEWTSNLTFSANRNKIISLYGTDLDEDGVEDDDISNNWFIGHPITSYYDYVFNGIYQVGDPDIPSGQEAGFVRLKDLNGDGEIKPDDDRKIVGTGGEPDYRIGFGNTFSYRNLSLYIFMNSMVGWVSPFDLYKTISYGRGLNQVDAEYWTAENKSNSRPSTVYNYPIDHDWYLSRDFLRIQDASLTYRIPKNLSDRLGLSQLSIFISGKNLYTFTKWPGSDPESGETYVDALYPMPRTVSLGVNLGF